MKSERMIMRHRLAAALLAMAALTSAYGQGKGETDKLQAAIQLRTNTIFDLALCPNIGLEVQTSTGFAWQLDYVGAWWNNDSRHRYYSNYGLQTELRYYLNKNKEDGIPFYSHHVGLYGQTVTYDFEFGGTGWQSPHFNYSYGVGISYGYSLAISNKLGLDLTAGIGYFTSKYYEYEPKRTDGYLKTDTRRLNYFGPTKLEATIVWNITDRKK